METLRRLRTERGLSQAKLAARAELDPSTVNQIERGAREASPATLRKLADALDVGLAEILEDSYPKAGRRSPSEPTFNDVLADERRRSRFADVIAGAADRWGEDMSSADMDDSKRFGLIEAALGLSDLISQSAEEEDWNTLPNPERRDIVTTMQKLVEAAERGLKHLQETADTRTQEAKAKQRREQMREWTQEISA
jgi:transcriptional regulator with XRE-family HTH domain